MLFEGFLIMSKGFAFSICFVFNLYFKVASVVERMTLICCYGWDILQATPMKKVMSLMNRGSLPKSMYR